MKVQAYNTTIHEASCQRMVMLKYNNEKQQIEADQPNTKIPLYSEVWTKSIRAYG